MKNLKLILIILVVFIFASCGKKDEKVSSENQSSSQNVAPDNKTNPVQQPDINIKWIGKYSFNESAKNVTGDGAQSWIYIIDVIGKDDKTLTAIIQIDGFQTMTRITADVKPSEKSAEFIFSAYQADNMFEVYKKGDKLFTFEVNDKNEMVTNWEKMKANVISNQKNGTGMFKKVSS